MNAGQQIVIGLCVFLFLWFIVFNYLNRRRGISAYRWLRQGLEKVIGEVTEASWIGSSASGAHLVVAKARGPFRSMEVIYLLVSREILPLWIFNRLRGKRDELIIKASLKQVPVEEVEVAPPQDKEFVSLLAREQKRPYERIPIHPEFEVGRRGRKNPRGINALQNLLERYPEAIQRISLQRVAPQLVVRVALPSIVSQSADEFLSALSRWMETVVSTGNRT
jgi:hypothetical protein